MLTLSRAELHGTRRVAVLGLLIAAASVIHYIESTALPYLQPLHLGLANIVSLIALELIGLRGALFVAITRCLLGGLLSGNMSALPLAMSEAGAVSSVCAMGVLIRWPSLFSIVGVSLAGALISNVAQITVLVFTVAHSGAMFGMLVYLWPTTIVGGAVCGVLAQMILSRLPGRFAPLT